MDTSLKWTLFSGPEGVCLQEVRLYSQITIYNVFCYTYKQNNEIIIYYILLYFSNTIFVSVINKHNKKIAPGIKET